MTAWTTGRFVGYDLESTGTDPLTARIVTAAVVYAQPGQRPRSIEWLLDPGCEVPEEAAAIHGWTREKILAQVSLEGCAVRMTRRPDGTMAAIRMSVDGALGEIVGHVGVAMHTDTPLVIANAAYDCTLTESECARLGVDPLSSRPAGIKGVVDPMVLTRQWDPYRKVKQEGGCRGGKYKCGGCGAPDSKLGSLCRHYGVPLTNAHFASADALAAVRLAKRLADLWPDIARLKLPTLHAHQRQWRAEQMASLEKYHRRQGVADGDYDRGWPLHSSLTTSTPLGATA